MIDFTLAKQLAEAGYPQNKWGHAVNEQGAHITFGGELVEGFYHVPKLNKLIEACKAHPRAAGSFILEGHGDVWSAYSDPDDVVGKGESAEEAAVRLFIALYGNT